MIRIATLAASLLLAAGCGGREPLRPAPGQSMPVAPAMAAATPTTEDLLTPPPIARPQRVDELLRRSEEREDDRFDLPPQ
jgi:PBP1b-binding outer membrane lipoprotein LpoB